MNNKFNVFLNNTHIENLDVEDKNFLKKLENALNPFLWRKDNVFYDADFVSKICEETKTYNQIEENVYFANFGEKIRDILQNAQQTETYTKKSNEKVVFYFVWQIEKLNNIENADGFLVNILGKKENAQKKMRIKIHKKMKNFKPQQKK